MACHKMISIKMTTSPNWTDTKKPILLIRMTNSPTWANVDQLRMLSHFVYTKIVKLLHMLDMAKLFGAVRAVVPVVEYQKRGLPLTYMSFSL